MIVKLCPLYDGEAGFCGLTPALIATLAVIGLGWLIGSLSVLLLPGLAIWILLRLFK